MTDVPYGITKELPDTPFEEAVQRITGAIGEEGFGVLTETVPSGASGSPEL